MTVYLWHFSLQYALFVEEILHFKMEVFGCLLAKTDKPWVLSCCLKNKFYHAVLETNVIQLSIWKTLRILLQFHWCNIPVLGLTCFLNCQYLVWICFTFWKLRESFKSRFHIVHELCAIDKQKTSKDILKTVGILTLRWCDFTGN